MKLRVSYEFGYDKKRMDIWFVLMLEHRIKLYLATGRYTWLGKLARKVLMDGKICTIEDAEHLTFEIDESGVEFMKCAKELGGKKYGVWRAGYMKLVNGTPLEEVMQDIIAHTLGSVLSKDLEDKNGSHNLRRENDLRALQLHTSEVKGRIRFKTQE